MWVVFFLLYHFLIAVCCEAPQTIMDVVLYKIKYYYIKEVKFIKFRTNNRAD